MDIICKSLFKGAASIGSHILEEAKAKNETIVIKHDGMSMTVPPYKFGKFFTMGNKKYPHKNGSGFYTLHYIKYEGDKNVISL